MCLTREKTVLGHDDPEDRAKGSTVVFAGRDEHLVHGEAAYPEGFSILRTRPCSLASKFKFLGRDAMLVLFCFVCIGKWTNAMQARLHDNKPMWQHLPSSTSSL